MIRISLSFLNWRTTSCLAVETHLKNVICNTTKFDADCRYREDQIKKLKKNVESLKIGHHKIGNKEDCHNKRKRLEVFKGKTFI